MRYVGSKVVKTDTGERHNVLRVRRHGNEAGSHVQSELANVEVRGKCFSAAHRVLVLWYPFNPWQGRPRECFSGAHVVLHVVLQL